MFKKFVTLLKRFSNTMLPSEKIVENKIHIISNKIQTPDGTILISRHVHDFVSHVDNNGEEYFTDGGTEYLHRSLNKIDYKDLTIYSNSPFEKIRESFQWGTFGIDGSQPLKYVLLCDMTDSHIKMVLNSQTHLPQWKLEIFSKELYYRKSIN